MFSVTETFFPIVQDALTADVMFTVIKTYLVFTCCINGIGMIAMRVGVMKRSTFMTILTAIVLCAVLGNVLIAVYGNDQMNFILSGVIFARCPHCDLGIMWPHAPASSEISEYTRRETYGAYDSN